MQTCSDKGRDESMYGVREMKGGGGGGLGKTILNK